MGVNLRMSAHVIESRIASWCFQRYVKFEQPALLAVAIVFLALLAVVDIAGPTGLDVWLTERVQSIPWGDFRFVPETGSLIGGGYIGFYVVPGVAATLFALTGRWQLLLLLLATFALHYVTISPKLFIEASRPSPLFGVEGGGGLESFPSGHVQWATSFYGLLAYLTWRAVRGNWRWIVAGIYLAVVLGAVLGRIELGRHWPIDTLAGVLVGALALRALIGLSQFRRQEADVSYTSMNAEMTTSNSSRTNAL
jgi:membrane-associated phospholipid phosphatase